MGLANQLRDELLERWSEPHRHYHDVRHLANTLAALDRLGPAGRSVRLAVWFHDAVYAGVAGRDEEHSASLAQARLSGLLEPTEVSRIASLVRMTANHQPIDDEEALLSDADLSVLGLSRARYDVYVRDVRTDYEHVDDESWRLGRTAVLDDLLARPRIFHTAAGTALWGTAARANLLAERRRWAGAGILQFGE